MPHPIEPSTLRILKPTGETVGTGFLVSKYLAVTCAHVVKILGAGAGDTVDIRFTGKSAATIARVLPEYWRPDASTDIAILQVDETPAGVFPLRMGRASESRLKNDLYTFGYAIAADEQGIGGLGTFITLKQEGNFIQFRMHEANHGHSGAPIYDDKRGVVVGMVKKGHTGTGRNAETTFAIPTETLWQVCPQLKPPTPVLPRRNPIVEGINLLPYDYDVRIQNFLTEYLGTDSHPVPFGGRDDALKMLDTWLAETTPYLLLAAPAGRGKSALLVRWLDSLKAREDLSLAFVPVSIRFGTNMERVFYAALAARLAYLHGDDIPASPETSTAVYRGLVSDYLSKPLANGRTLLVVLDGLDEAADWRIKADFMPAELPAGVRVAVSARFLAGDADSTPWLRRLNWERNGLASAPSLTPLNQEGVRDVLFKMGCPLDELSRKVDIVKELHYLSAGDPLLVGLYVGDLWAKGKEVARLKPENLASIQPGYKGYFDRWWDDQKKLWGKDKPWLEEHIWTVLNLLAGALGPLFKDDLQTLAPELKSNFIADALDVLQRFIIGDNQTQGYTFSHPKLGQYFWETLTPNEQAQVEGQFLTWCEQTLQEFIDGKRDPKEKADVPVYVVHNYGAHLARIKQPLEKWLPLIHYQQWAQAWFTVESAFGGYLQDVERVDKICKLLDAEAMALNHHPSRVAIQIRCALIKSSVESSIQNIELWWLPFLVKEKIWTFSQAVAHIRQIQNTTHRKRALDQFLEDVYALRDDSSFESYNPYSPSGNPSESNYYQVFKLVKVEEFLLKIGRESSQYQQIFQEKLPKEQNITDYFGVEKRIKELINFYNTAPDLWERAIKAIWSIESIFEKYEMLDLLADHLPKCMIDKLILRASEVDRFERVKILSIIAKRFPELWGEVFTIAKSNERDFYAMLINYFNALTWELPNEKLIELLEIIRSGTEYESERNEALNILAKRLPDDRLDEVVEIVQSIQNISQRAKIFGTLAVRVPILWADALTCARYIGDLDGQISILTSLIKYIPKHEIGNLFTNLVRSRSKYNFTDYYEILRKIAENLPKEMLSVFLYEAQKIHDTEKRVEILITLVDTSPEIWNEVLVAIKILEKEKRDEATMALINKLPLAILRTILNNLWIPRNDISYVELICALAKRLPKNMVRQLLEITQTIKLDGESWFKVQIAFATRMPELWNNVLDATQTIPYEWELSRTLRAIVKNIPDVFLERILAQARGMHDSNASIDILADLAERKPELWSNVLVMVRNVRGGFLKSILEHLPEKMFREALNITQGINDEVERYYALCELLAYLPVELFDDEIIDSAIEIEIHRVKAWALHTLAGRLPIEKLTKLLDALKSWDDDYYRAQVLCSLISRLSHENLDDALTIMQTIQNHSDRTEVLNAFVQRIPDLAGKALAQITSSAELIDLIQYLPEERLGDAFKIIFQMNEWEYADVLRAITSRLNHFTHQKNYKWIDQVMIFLSSNNRRNELFTNLAIVMPFILQVSPPNTPREIYEAVRDVTTWWP